MVFGADYAAAYDTLYADKDYVAECALVKRIFASYALHPVRRVLDLGCGSGRHAVSLAEAGHCVVGVDRSADMLRRARERGSAARFELGDIRDVLLNETFDAVLMMFAVLGYQVRNDDVERALATARRHLEPGGVLFSDVWYGPAVLAQRPTERVKVIDTPDGGQIIRAASGELDIQRNVCNVNYRLWRLNNQHVLAEVGEQHAMRYFFAPEVELLLAHNGFELLRVGAFPKFDDEPSEQTWNVAFVARAV